MLEQNINIQYLKDFKFLGNFSGIVENHTEAWYTQIDANTYEFRVRSTEDVEKAVWTLGPGNVREGTSIGENFSTVPASVSVQVYYSHKPIENIVLNIPSTRDTTPVGGILKVNNTSQIWRSETTLTSIDSIQKILPDIQYTPTPPQMILKMVNQPQIGDTFTFNGFVFTWMNEPTSPVHVQIGFSIEESIQNLVDVISTTYDPRLFKNKLDYLAEYNELRICTGLKDSNLLGLVTSWTGSAWEGDGILRGLWLEYEYSMSIDPMIPSWNSFNILPVQTDSFQEYYFMVRATRVSNIEDEWLYVKGFNIEGTWCIPKYDGSALMIFTHPGQKAVFSPEYNYTVNKIDSVFVKATGITPDRRLDVKFRVSFTNGRQWTDFYPLSVGGICAINVNPIGFFKIEYLVERVGSDATGVIELYDIMLQGDLINVTCDYAKEQYLGINKACFANLVKGNNLGIGFNEKGLNDIDQDYEEAWNKVCEEGTLFNPYKLDEISKIYEQRVREMNAVLGRPVTYFRTAADPNSIDHVLHEYSLYDRYEHKDMKVLVPDNQFPSLYQGFGIEDMLLEDKFEIHITKHEFKRLFGITARPRKQDSIFFCDVNLIYDVVEAQEAREVMNFSVYYKVMLRKHVDSKAVRTTNVTTDEFLSSLTDAKKIENILDPIQKTEEERVLKKEQLKPRSEPTWSFRRANTIKVKPGNILVGSNVIARYHFDLTEVEPDEYAVEYDDMHNVFTDCDSAAISLWFQLTQVSSDETILLDNYIPVVNTPSQNTLPVGWRLSVQNKTIRFRLNDYVFELPSKSIQATLWYGLIVSIDQLSQKVTLSIWQRVNGDIVQASTKTFNLPSTTYTHDEKIVIPGGGDLKLTQIRVWNDSIDKSDEKLILLQPIAIDSNRLIVVDNCEPQEKWQSAGTDKNRY